MNTLKQSVILMALAFATSYANADTKVKIEAKPVSEQIYVLFGQGGNIAAHVGDDGTYIIDDQFAKLAPQIKAQLKELNPNAPEFVINTHHHGDHTGGNEVFAQAGAHVIAHDNVHKRLAEKHGADSDFVPRLSFSDDLTLRFNGELAKAVHFAHAHTDGDAVIFFENANVVHMGDIYFNTGSLPFVDVDSGGSVDGLLAAVKSVAERIGDDTVVIPGHGPISNKAGLLKYHALVSDAKATMLGAIKEHKTLEQVLSVDPLAQMNLEYAKWLPKERVTTLFYRSLSGEVNH